MVATLVMAAIRMRAEAGARRITRALGPLAERAG
jgi:hypothetical protein